MAQGHVFLIVLLSCVAQLFAVRSCDEIISAQVSAKPQSPVPYIQAFSNQKSYLVSATPDDEFGFTDTYYIDFNTSCGNTLVYKISQTFLNGASRLQTRAVIKESGSEYLYEPGFDLYLNFFICGGDLVVVYKCKPNAYGHTVFLILAPYGTPADKEAVDACKKDISCIFPSAQFKDYEYPTCGKIFS